MIEFTFPQGFLWGTATAAFQVEGAAAEDGKGPSIWDTAPKLNPEKYWKQQTPEVGADFYHRYPSDIAEMKELGLKSLRLSISWPRVVPDGTGAVNRAGLDFYDRVIDLLLSNGIEPFVDLFHWDLPQALLDVGGLKNREIVSHFEKHVRVCFERLGDRVKLWSTLNEPSIFAFGCYLTGWLPPYETDLGITLLAAHSLNLMHHAAVRAYRETGMGGKMGSVVAFEPVYPRSLSEEDKAAASRQQDFLCGWWLDPIFHGRYPASVARHPDVAPLMPEGYEDELAAVWTPPDFIGLNYYRSFLVGAKPGAFLGAERAETLYTPSGCGDTHPQGLLDAITYVTDRYNKPEIYVTENGIQQDDTTHTRDELLQDDVRVNYMREHLRALSRAIRAGADVRGYYHWSHFDTWEMTGGYRFRYGINHIDLDTLERTHKKSWHYYQQCIAANAVD